MSRFKKISGHLKKCWDAGQTDCLPISWVV